MDIQGWKKNGLQTLWDGNGQKKGEWNWKNGKPDGLYTDWYENGQKMLEGTYKDLGLFEVIGRWNKDGSVREEPFKVEGYLQLLK
jgi:antitoxin component YwqK of YwqJK toxin-antitoxin module